MPPTFEESIDVLDWKFCIGSEGKTHVFDMINILLVLMIFSEISDQNCSV